MRWHVQRGDVGMGLGGAEIPAPLFHVANPVFILLFGVLFTAMGRAAARASSEVVSQRPAAHRVQEAAA